MLEMDKLLAIWSLVQGVFHPSCLSRLSPPEKGRDLHMEAFPGPIPEPLSEVLSIT